VQVWYQKNYLHLSFRVVKSEMVLSDGLKYSPSLRGRMGFVAVVALAESQVKLG
jgi:hypothetical protein